ncbi:conserved hypothetical protein [Ricinus communis]|uniref:Uncharacterized protein n=1 Tax=Ricinus communis TaxID=3988 RepID=B9RLB1_RICCO|nr:conserved hypothetical protein [Ricinus communis]|eukprot:XP_002514530.1 uncharacterized protein LOC8264526 [Ricinus communis]
MKERGKAVEVFNDDQEYYTSSYYDLPCKKHPSSSSVGICAYCLKDRLVKLVCSDCGEQRLSSCSCSEISSNRNSCTVEVGSVGRISFLIENDNQRNEGNSSSSSQFQSQANSNKPKICREKTTDDVFLLKRSSSSCVEIKRKSGFWRIGKLFSKKREKGNNDNNNNNNNCERSSVGGFEEKSDLWVVDYMGVSRSRSLCSFRGGGFFGSEDGTFSGARSSMSAARSSISAARNSGVNGGLLFDPDRKSGFSEAEPRKSGYDGEKKDTVLDPEKLDSCYGTNNPRRVFSLKEGNFTTIDDSGFIDLKFDFPSSDSKSELPYIVKMGGGGALSDSISAFGSMRGGDFLAQDHYSDGLFSNGGSCRITVSDRGIKRSRKSFKSWRWIFRPNHPNAKKKEEDQEDIVVSNHT